MQITDCIRFQNLQGDTLGAVTAAGAIAWIRQDEASPVFAETQALPMPSNSSLGTHG